MLPLVAPVAIDDSYRVNLGRTSTCPRPGVLGNDLRWVASLSAAEISTPDKGTLNVFNAMAASATGACGRRGADFQPVLKWANAFPGDGLTTAA